MTAYVLVLALAPVEVGCTTCHPVEKVAFEQSVHHAEGIGCDSCHGGDPTTLDETKAHGQGYLGVPARQEIPARCGTCHADPEAMRPYNLPIDQLALYRISEHGRRLADGGTEVAVCTDCHGAHEVRSAEDPESPVFRTRIPGTCARCHADESLMSSHGLSAEVVEEYRTSVHGRALLEESNPAAPSCARCHGVHGASPPGAGDVAKVCGQCHASARDFFDTSEHKAAMMEADLPECASCHGNHGIGPAGSELAREVCLECHAPTTDPAEAGRKLLALASSTAREIDEATELIAEAQKVPIAVEDYVARLELARTRLKEVYPAMHSLDVDVVMPLAVSARSEAEDIQHEIYEKFSNIRWRRSGLVLFWFYIVLTIAILVRLRRQGRSP